MTDFPGLRIGSIVRAWKHVYDTEYSTTGAVVSITYDPRGKIVKIADNETGGTDWYRVGNDETHTFEVIKP